MESKIAPCITSASVSEDKKSEMIMLLIQNGLKDILLSDKSTKLWDLLIFMLDYCKFSDFLNNLRDVNITVPLDSPIWPGYSLLHLCVILKGKIKLSEDSEMDVDLPETTDTMEQDKEALYVKRIELCLERGCSISMKNANKQTPIHLAFNMPSESALDKLLSFSEDNDVDRNSLSH